MWKVKWKLYKTHSQPHNTHTHMSWTHIETGNWSGICRDSGQSDLMRTYLSLSTVTTHKPKSEWERWLHCLVCAHCFAHFYRPSTFIQHNHIRLSVYTHSHIYQYVHRSNERHIHFTFTHMLLFSLFRSERSVRFRVFHFRCASTFSFSLK